MVMQSQAMMQPPAMQPCAQPSAPCAQMTQQYLPNESNRLQLLAFFQRTADFPSGEAERLSNACGNLTLAQTSTLWNFFYHKVDLAKSDTKTKLEEISTCGWKTCQEVPTHPEELEKWWSYFYNTVDLPKKKAAEEMMKVFREFAWALNKPGYVEEMKKMFTALYQTADFPRKDEAAEHLYKFQVGPFGSGSRDHHESFFPWGYNKYRAINFRLGDEFITKTTSMFDGGKSYPRPSVRSKNG